MMRSPLRLAADRAGSAAAELALTLPLLLILMFGSFEMGYYFLSEHVVQKSVRDAARYASRLSMTNFDCVNETVPNPLRIQNVARTGDPDGIDPQRLQGWTEPGMTDVTLTCDDSGPYTGIYTDFPGGVVPVVTVSASVPYPSLFGTLGLGNPSLMLNAQSQSAVFGA